MLLDLGFCGRSFGKMLLKKSDLSLLVAWNSLVLVFMDIWLAVSAFVVKDIVFDPN